MAVINDIGNLKDIHPPNKQDVGKRLARWALHQEYGIKDIVVSGPLYLSHQVNDKTIEITFSYAKGLKTSDGKAPGAFEILGENDKWLPAEAEIKEDTIIIRHDQITDSSQARYAWHMTAKGANLINAEGLPTSCFTTVK